MSHLIAALDSTVSSRLQGTDDTKRHWQNNRCQASIRSYPSPSEEAHSCQYDEGGCCCSREGRIYRACKQAAPEWSRRSRSGCTVGWGGILGPRCPPVREEEDAPENEHDCRRADATQCDRTFAPLSREELPPRVSLESMPKDSQCQHVWHDYRSG